jgi:hypothetical protein
MLRSITDNSNGSTIVLASGLIIISSSALFLYWFRYMCLLLLVQEDSAEYAFQVASNIQLSFLHVQAALQTLPRSAALDRLHERLDQDYQLLTELLRHPGGDSIEHRILRVDYQVMRVWYQLTRTSRHPQQARKALREMSSILGYFAAEIGESATL